MTELILFGSLALMIFINIPIAIALGLASIFTLLYTGDPLGVVPAMMQATVQKFTCNFRFRYRYRSRYRFYLDSGNG